VTANLLAFLRTACPKLRKLAPSRWAEHTAMAEVAQFPALEVRVVSLQLALAWQAVCLQRLCWPMSGRQCVPCKQLHVQCRIPPVIVEAELRAAVCQQTNQHWHD
jgi:hypothetical protein